MATFEAHLMASQTGRHSSETTRLNAQQMIEFKRRLQEDVMLLGKVCSRVSVEFFTKNHQIGDNEIVSAQDSYLPPNFANQRAFAASVATRSAIVAAIVTEGILLPGSEWPEGRMIPDGLYEAMVAVDNEERHADA